MKDTWEAISSTRGLNASAAELLEYSNRLHLRHVREDVRVLSGVVELACLLRDAGFAIAVTSGSSQEVIRVVLSCASLDCLYPVQVSAEEVKYGKPEPFIFLEASRLLSVEPDRYVLVEDASVGVEAGLRARGAVCGGNGRRCARASTFRFFRTAVARRA
ncbi:HAD family hydrolase [Streptomyces rubiginosohelvolus]